MLDGLEHYIKPADPADIGYRKVALYGPPGTGKTWGALALAEAFGGRVVVLSMGEHGAECIYGARFEFDRLDMAAVAAAQPPPPVPLDGLAHLPLRAGDPRLLAWVVERVAAVYDTVIVDNLSDAWSTMLGMVDAVGMSRRGETDMRRAWMLLDPAWSRAWDALMSCQCNTIMCIRSKRAADDEVADMRERDMVRPHLVMRMGPEHTGKVVKSRYPGVPLGATVRLDLATARAMVPWRRDALPFGRVVRIVPDAPDDARDGAPEGAGGDIPEDTWTGTDGGAA